MLKVSGKGGAGMKSPEWDAVREEVLRKLKLLQLAWEETKTVDAELHRKMVQDIYQPALRLLAEFCACIQEGGEA
jgi:hypothetical protein